MLCVLLDESYKSFGVYLDVLEYLANTVRSIGGLGEEIEGGSKERKVEGRYSMLAFCPSCLRFCTKKLLIG
jgi:hypothetical protein